MTSTVVYEGNLRTVCSHEKSGSIIETDAPPDNQGLGERFSPTDMVATALGSCMLTIMGMKARDMNVDIKGIKIDVEKIMKADPRRIGGINLTFHLPDTLQVDEKQKTILERAAHTCPVMYSIHPDIEVKVTFKDGSSEWHYVPLSLQFGEKPEESFQSPRIVYDEWKWTHPTYIIASTHKLMEMVSIEIDPTHRLADINPRNNKLELRF